MGYVLFFKGGDLQKMNKKSLLVVFCVILVDRGIGKEE